MSFKSRLFQSSGITLSEHYKVLTWTGSGTSPGQSRSITGVPFSPDIVICLRYQTSGSEDIYWFTRKHTVTSEDEVYYNRLDSATGQDVGGGDILGWLSNGFKVGYKLDESGHTWIAFCWKVNGNTSNPDVNTDSLMSLWSYTGTGTYRNLGHGLGVSDVFPLIKNISSNYDFTSRPIGVSWTDYCKWTTGGCYDDYYTWQDTASGTNVRLGTRAWVNQNSQTHLMWTMAPVDGASAMGTYTGNGDSSSGTSVNLGFQPTLLVAGTADEGQTTETWLVTNKHQGGNTNLRIKPLSTGVWSNTNANCDFTSTGFTIKSSQSTWNGNGNDYWYWAWADPDIVG